jgi:hypothetical protein
MLMLPRSWNRAVCKMLLASWLLFLFLFGWHVASLCAATLRYDRLHTTCMFQHSSCFYCKLWLVLGTCEEVNSPIRLACSIYVLGSQNKRRHTCSEVCEKDSSNLFSANTALTAPKSKQKDCCSIHCNVVPAVSSVLRILGLGPGVSYVLVEMDLGD